MADYSKQDLFRYLGMNLISKPKSLTLDTYLDVSTNWSGTNLVNYLINNGVPKTINFYELITNTSYGNLISKAINYLKNIETLADTQEINRVIGLNSDIDVPQNELSIEPQNKFMSYNPTNKTIDDSYAFNGYMDYPPIIWTGCSVGDYHVLELYYVQSVLADGTLIFEAYDTNEGNYHWVAMRRSAHNPKNLEFVDALMYTPQFDNYGFGYTIKNDSNSVTFLDASWSSIYDVYSKTTTLTINNKGKLSAVDDDIKMSFTGLLGLYNELTGESYVDFSIYDNIYPITTFNDDFYQLMNGSKLGTHYFPISEVDNGGGLSSVFPYENILAVNFLTGTYELINATEKLQEVVDSGKFNNDLGNLNDAFIDVSSHPEGILFSLSDNLGLTNYNLEGVTRVWSPEWTNYINPVPLTTRYLDDNIDNNGTYSSYSGYIFNDYSDDDWNLSSKHLYTFYNSTSSGYYGPFGGLGESINYIYRFELNPETYNNEPELQSIPKSTGIKYPIISYSGYYGPGEFSFSIGKAVNFTYQFPTNNGIAFSNSASYYSDGYGAFELNYWNDSSVNPIALGSNLNYPGYYTNNTVIQTSSSYYRSVYKVNVDKYKGINFGL